MIFYQRLLLLFILLPQLLCAQSSSYKVVNNTDDNPIEGVLIQYTDLNQQKQILFSNPNGIIELNTSIISSTDSLQVICLGYDQAMLAIADLTMSKIIRLNPKPIVLDEVTITPINANKILQKAILNTKNKLCKEYPIEYTATLQYNTADSVQFQKINLKYSSILKDTNLNKDKLPYILILIDLKKQGSIQSERLKNKNFYAWYHLNRMSNTIPKNYQVKLSRFSDNEVFILDCYPSKNSKQWRHLTFYINTNDTTINSINMEIIENLVEKNQYIKKGKYRTEILKEKFNIQFSIYEGNYYFSSGTYHNQIEFNHKENSETVEYYQQTQASGFKKKENVLSNNKKLSGYSKEVFDF